MLRYDFIYFTFGADDDLFIYTEIYRLTRSLDPVIFITYLQTYGLHFAIYLFIFLGLQMVSWLLSRFSTFSGEIVVTFPCTSISGGVMDIPLSSRARCRLIAST